MTKPRTNPQVDATMALRDSLADSAARRGAK